MMLEWFIWLFLFAILTATVLLIHHWAELLRLKESYTRSELLGIAKILRQELHDFFSRKGRLGRYGAYAAFAVGALLAWGVTLFGSLFSPALSPLPDYAAASLSNYFFQSAALLIVLHFTWPAMEDLAGATLKKLLAGIRQPLLFAFAIGLAAMNVAIWGIYHQMNFLYILINMLLTLSYAAYCLHRLSPSTNAATDAATEATGESATDTATEATGESATDTTTESTGRYHDRIQ